MLSPPMPLTDQYNFIVPSSLYVYLRLWLQSAHQSGLILRIITSSRHDAPSKILIKLLGWRTIGEIIEYQSQVMGIKPVNGLAPQYFCELFIRNCTNPAYGLRSTIIGLQILKKN